MLRKVLFRLRTEDRGAQAVEFALIWVFVLAPLVYGLIAFGFVMNQQITASQLAREAARSAAICVNGAVANAGTCNLAGQNRFDLNRPKGFNGSVSVDTSSCFPTASGHDATATVTVSPVLAVPLLPSIKGKATTPCGG
jgi:Flp pilus assembly protein TadG